ncbi:CfaE/CblD family pilus tip adhesin [Burkholderia cenocepacia]|uniref:CfaE/CblD family pilus tip adhesin n=1 Tax=Burkholderia cenocepacia TaxID=95486 RepID=UPI002657E562|nr:CfaE/CblD family pilus tip adhesin [Burkholderia cenocepacia]
MLYINRISRRAIVLTVMLGVLSVDALAVMQAPADRNDTVQATRDRGAPLGDVVIFDGALGGYDSSDPAKWGRNSWTCQSSTDPASGACPTQTVWAVGGDSTVIKLLFKEEKTGATAVLNLKGSKTYVLSQDCSGNAIPLVFSTIRHPIEQAVSTGVPGCTNNIVWDGRALYVTIPADELKKLPSGGTWKGSLQLNLKMWDPDSTVGIFRAAITLNTSDKNNIQVYLPEFASATPIVDLKLRKLPNGSRMSGTSNIDMCLYDGYNSQSTWFDVSASDGLTIDRRDNGQYSVLLASDKSGAYESRVDYTVSLTYAGKKIALPNNETVRLQGVNNSAGRSVTLPGISVPVVCTPTPLTLETPEFQSVWKRPGTYSSKLTITFTPSSASL